MMKKRDISVLTQFIENVKYLASVNKKGIGNIEKEAGVSIGFISRMGTSDIGLVTAYRLSKALDVPIDDLIERNLVKNYKIQLYEKKIEELQGEIAKLKGGSHEKLDTVTETEA